MKTLLALLVCMSAGSAFAETCTVVMKDYYRSEVQRFTRFSYSYQAACDEAQYDCKQDLAEREVRGAYGLTCSELLNSPSYPTPYPSPYPPSYPPSYPTPYPPSYPPSYPTPYPPSYPPRYPAPAPYPTPYPHPLPPRDPHWPDHGPDRDHDRDGDRDHDHDRDPRWPGNGRR